MHILKNVGSNGWDYLIGLKDSVAITTDLQSVCSMQDVWSIEKHDGKVSLPKAWWSRWVSEQTYIASLFRMPTSYTSGLKRAFLKSKNREWSNLVDWKRIQLSTQDATIYFTD